MAVLLAFCNNCTRGENNKIITFAVVEKSEDDGWRNRQWTLWENMDKDDLNKFLQQVAPVKDGIEVVASRLIHKKTREYCQKSKPDYTSCYALDINGQCQCHAMMSLKDNECVGSTETIRNCVELDGNGNICYQCKPGYYVLKSNSRNEEHRKLEGQCRRGSERCNYDCPFCDTQKTCGVEKTEESDSCEWRFKKNDTCFQCKENYVLDEYGNCNRIPHPKLEGCNKMSYNYDNDLFECLECRPDHKAVADIDPCPLSIRDSCDAKKSSEERLECKNKQKKCQIHQMEVDFKSRKYKKKQHTYDLK